MEDSKILEWSRKQPEKIDYLRPNGFRFLIHSLPKVTYFCQSANIPQISLGVATQPTPLVDIPLPGEKITYSELTIRFMIQEDLANYTELYNWMLGLGFPTSREQFSKLIGGRPMLFPEVNYKADGGEVSDATLLVLDSNNQAAAQIMFYDCFPVALSGLDFDVSTGNMQYFQASATFRYRQYVLERVNKTT
jgi:hypothetical protein